MTPQIHNPVQWTGMGPFGNDFSTGGHAPTAYERMQQDRIRAHNLENYRRSAMNDPYSQAVTGTAAMFLSGGNAQQARGFLESPGGGMFRELMSIPVSGGLMGGGNRYNMQSHLQQALGMGGRVRDANTGRTMAMQGSGAAISDMSGMWKESITSHFTNSAGQPIAGRSQGYNVEQLGQIAGFMGTRGAFAGAPAMSLRELRSKEEIENWQKEPENAARAKTDPAFAKYLEKQMTDFDAGRKPVIEEQGVGSDGKGFLEKSNKMLEETAAAMRVAQDIVGGNDFGEMMTSLEQTTGMAMTGFNSNEVKARYEKIVNDLKGAGVTNIKAATEAIGALGDIFGARLGNPAAGRMMASNVLGSSITAYQGQTAAASRAAEKGNFIPRFSQEEIQDQMAKDTMGIAGDEDELAAAAYALSDPGTSEADRASIVAAMNEMKQAGGDDGKVLEARGKLDALVVKTQGRSTADLLADKNIGRKGIERGISDKANSLRADAVEGIREGYARDITEPMANFIAKKGGSFAGMGEADAQEFLKTSLVKLGDENYREIAANAGKYDDATVMGYMREKGLIDIAGGEDAALKYIQQMRAGISKSGGVDNMMTQLDSARWSLGEKGKGIITDADKREQAKGALAATLASQVAGADSRAPGQSLIESMVAGGTGGQDISSSMLVEFAANKDKLKGNVSTFTIRNDDGTFQDMDKSQIDKMAAMAGGRDALASKLGVDPSDDAAIARALGTAEGSKGAHEALKAAGASSSYNPATGELQVMGESSTSAAAQALQTAVDANTWSIMNTGKELSAKEYETIAEDSINGTLSDAMKEKMGYNKDVTGDQINAALGEGGGAETAEGQARIGAMKQYGSRSAENKEKLEKAYSQWESKNIKQHNIGEDKYDGIKDKAGKEAAVRADNDAEQAKKNRFRASLGLGVEPGQENGGIVAAIRDALSPPFQMTFTMGSPTGTGGSGVLTKSG